MRRARPAPAEHSSERCGMRLVVSVPGPESARFTQGTRVSSNRRARQGACAQALSRADGHQDVPQAARVAAGPGSPELFAGQTGPTSDAAIGRLPSGEWLSAVRVTPRVL